MATYTTTKVKFDDMKKALHRVFKKMDAIGAEYKFEVIREFVRTVPVYAIDHEQQTKYNTHNDVRVECVEFVLDFDKYIVGDYRVGAVVERTIEDNVNVVYTIDDTVNFKQYTTGALRCDHCKRNHNRVKTVVLIDNQTGEHKMVGKGCLKDFVGIEVENFAKYIHDIEEIVLGDEELKIYDTDLGRYKICVDVVEYLANCIKVIAETGYTKKVKETAFTEMKKGNIEERFIEEAKKVIEFFKNIELDEYDTFENNVKNFVTGKIPVTGENGFIAYAPVLMEKIQKQRAEHEARNAEKAKSDYVGEIGKKITITGKGSVITSYQTQWGFTTIYKFVDENDNVFIWKTSNTITGTENHGDIVYVKDMETITITGTVKEHNEYNGEKQTVLTRCKVSGFTLTEERKAEENKEVKQEDTDVYFKELMDMWTA